MTLNAYQQQFKLLRTAQIGVIVTQTKEPARVVELLLAYAAAGEREKRAIYKWDCVTGWELFQYGEKKGQVSQWKEVDGETENIVDGLTSVRDFKPSSIAVMIHPHPWFEDTTYTPEILTIIRTYCEEFRTEDGHTLVLVVPEGQKLPIEIVSDLTLLNLELPSENELKSLAKSIMEDVRPAGPNDLLQLAASAAGMTTFEADRSFRTAIAKNYVNLSTIPLATLCADVLSAKADVIAKSQTLVLYPPCDISKVGGLHGIKHWLNFNKTRLLRESLELGADPLLGLLLVGPPGTGKSLISKAIASVFGLPLIRLDIGALFGGIVGESEQKTATTMAIIRAMGNCVIWIDEIDKAGLSPGAAGDSGAGSRILQTLLFQMQEMKTGAFWVITANDIGQIPIELIRPGRLDEKFFVDIPDAEAREDVARIHLRQRKQDFAMSLDNFVAVTDGFISSEIEKVISDSVTWKLKHGKPITEAVLVHHAKEITPTSIAFKEKFDRMRSWGKQHAKDASVIPTERAIIAQPSVVAKKSTRPSVTPR